MSIENVGNFQIEAGRQHGDSARIRVGCCISILPHGFSYDHQSGYCICDPRFCILFAQGPRALILMKKLIFAVLALLPGVMSVSAEKTVRFDFQTSEARTIDVSPTTYIHPLVAEVVVNTKEGRLHDTWTLTPAEFISRQYPDNDAATLNNLRAYGLFKSSEKHNCDLIVAPTFDIKISDTGVVINLFGYPANFANWNSATSADYKWISIERGEVAVEAENSAKKPEPKK